MEIRYPCGVSVGGRDAFAFLSSGVSGALAPVARQAMERLVAGVGDRARDRQPEIGR